MQSDNISRINKLHGVPDYWQPFMINKRRAYFTSKDAAARFRDNCHYGYIMSAPLTDDWFGSWVVFYN